MTTESHLVVEQHIMFLLSKMFAIEEKKKKEKVALIFYKKEMENISMEKVTTSYNSYMN